MKQIYIVKGCYGYNGKRHRYYQNKGNLDKAWKKLVKEHKFLGKSAPPMKVYYADANTALRVIQYP